MLITSFTRKVDIERLVYGGTQNGQSQPSDCVLASDDNVGPLYAHPKNKTFLGSSRLEPKPRN